VKLIISLLISILCVSCASNQVKTGEDEMHKKKTKNVRAIPVDITSPDKGIIRSVQRKHLFDIETITSSLLKAINSQNELAYEKSALTGPKEVLVLNPDSYDVLIGCHDNMAKVYNYHNLRIELEKGNDYTIFCLKETGKNFLGLKTVVALYPFVTKTENLVESMKKNQEFIDIRKNQSGSK
jgi:hypothetical protein